MAVLTIARLCISLHALMSEKQLKKICAEKSARPCLSQIKKHGMTETVIPSITLITLTLTPVLSLTFISALHSSLTFIHPRNTKVTPSPLSLHVIFFLLSMSSVGKLGAFSSSKKLHQSTAVLPVSMVVLDPSVTSTACAEEPVLGLNMAVQTLCMAISECCHRAWSCSLQHDRARFSIISTSRIQTSMPVLSRARANISLDS